jgi:hypothetical protein
MNPDLERALERCPPVSPQTLEEFLGGLLDEEPERLARLPGTPATVLAAQFTYYAKTSVQLAETLRRDLAASRQLDDTIRRLDLLTHVKQKEAAYGPDHPADKGAHAAG